MTPRDEVVALLRIGCHRLRIERVQAGVTGFARGDDHGPGEMAYRRRSPVETAVGLETLILRVPLERRQAVDRRLAVSVFHRLENVQLTLHNWSADREPWCP